MRKFILPTVTIFSFFLCFVSATLAQDIFQPIVSKLLGMGILNAMLLFLFAAIMYAILRKSKIFGDSEIINGVIAFIVAFFIFVFPFLTGISLVNPLSIFFTQSMVILIFLVVGFMAASLFYPDMPSVLGKTFTSRGTLMVMIGLAIGLFVTSGLVTVLISAFSSPSGNSGNGSSGGAPSDVLIIGAGVILFIIVLLVASSVGMRGV